MVFNSTFNNTSAISWRSDYLEEETGIFGENQPPVASNWPDLSHNVVSSTPSLSGVRTHNGSSDRNGLDSWLLIQLPYDHDCPHRNLKQT